MGERLFGFRSSNATRTADVHVHEYDGDWGLDTVSTPIMHAKRWKYDDDKIHIGAACYGSVTGTMTDMTTIGTGDNNYLAGVAVSSLMVSSTSAGDKYPWGGVASSGGVHVVHVHYIDANWSSQIAEIQMSGQQPTMVATDVLKVNRVHSAKVGSSGSNAGDILIGSGGTTYLNILTGFNESACGYYHVPAGKNLIITEMWGGNFFGCVAASELYLIKEDLHTYDGTDYKSEVYRPLGNTAVTYIVWNTPQLVTPHLVEERCRLRIRYFTPDATLSGAAYIRGYLVNKYS